jgi:chromosome segregation ATPase
MDHNNQKIEACNKLNELQSVINSLTTENEQIKEKCKLGINSNNSLKREIDSLTSSHNNLNEQLKLANDNIETILKEKQDVTENLTKSELIRSRISNNHEANLVKYKEMNNEILAKARKENEELLNQKDEEIEKISFELSETKRTIFDQINLERTGLLEQFDKERDKISVEYSEARNKCIKLAKMNENLSNQIMIAKEEYEASKNILVKDYENKVDLLGKEVNNLNQRIIDNKKDYTSSLEKISVLSNPEKIKLESLKEEIITKDDIIEKLKLSTTDLQNKYIRIEAKCQHLEQYLNKERMEVDKQKEELLKKIAESSDSEKVQQNLKKIRDDSISTLREKKEEITRLNETINNLQDSLNKTTQELENIQQTKNNTV